MVFGSICSQVVPEFSGQVIPCSHVVSWPYFIILGTPISLLS
jgi:hypothetical protein